MNINYQLFFLCYGAVQHSPAFRAIALFVANYGDVVVSLAAVLFLLWLLIWKQNARSLKRGTWDKELFAVAVSVGTAWFVTFILKILFHAARPFVVFPLVHPLISETPYTSFPSGHATVFFALAVVMTYYHKRAGWLFLAAALVVSLSRVFAGVHFPGDILAGAVVGTSVAVMVHAWIKGKFKN